MAWNETNPFSKLGVTPPAATPMPSSDKFGLAPDEEPSTSAILDFQKQQSPFSSMGVPTPKPASQPIDPNNIPLPPVPELRPPSSMEIPDTPLAGDLTTPSPKPTTERVMTREESLGQGIGKPPPTQPQAGVKPSRAQTMRKYVGKEYDPGLLSQVEESFNGMMSAMSKLTETKTATEEELKPYMKAVANYVAMTDQNVDGSVANEYFKKVEKTKSEIRDVYSEIKDLESKKIDPDRYIKQMSGAAKVGAVVDAVFRSYMKMSGKGQFLSETSWADQIRQAAREDVNFQFNELKMQKDGATAKYRLLNDELKMHGDEVNAKLAMEAKLISAASADLEAKLKLRELTEGQQAALRAEQNKLKMGTALNLLQMTARGYEEQPMVNTGALTPDKLIEYRKDLLTRSIYVPSFTEDGQLVTDEAGNPILRPQILENTNGADKVKSMSAAAVGAIKTMNELKVLKDKAAIYKKAMPTEVKAEIKAKATALKMELKDYFALGAITGPDMELLDALVGDPTAIFFDVFDGTMKGFTDSLQKGLNNKMAALAPMTTEGYVAKVYGKDYIPVILNEDYLKDINFRQKQTFNNNVSAFRARAQSKIPERPEAMK